MGLLGLVGWQSSPIETGKAENRAFDHGQDTDSMLLFSDY